MLTIWGRLNSHNVKKVAWFAEELGLPYQRHDVGGTFGMDADYLAKNPEKVKKFAEAILKANAKANEDDANSRKVAEGYVDVDPKILGQAVLPTMGTKPVSADDLLAAVGRMARYGLVDESLKDTIVADMLK